MRYLFHLSLGVAVGLGLSFILPQSLFSGAIVNLMRVVVNIGHYLLYPTLFLGIISAMVANERRWLVARLNGLLLVFALATTTVAAVISSVSVIIINPSRIPLINQASAPLEVMGVQDILLQIFPQNLFAVFSGPGSLFVPLLLLALVIGLALRFEGERVSTLTNLFVEGARLFRVMLRVYAEFVGISFVILAMYTVSQLSGISDARIYGELIIILVVQTVAMIVIVLPLLSLAFRIHRNPFDILRRLIPASLAALLSGDSYYAAPLLLNTLQQDNGERRLSSSICLGTGLFFVRAGSALITGTLLFVVLQSYSALEIDIFTILRLIVLIIIISPLSSTTARLGVLSLLMLLIESYGQSVAGGYLIILPLTPLIAMLAACVDVITLGFAGYLLAENESPQQSPSAHRRRPSSSSRTRPTPSVDRMLLESGRRHVSRRKRS